MRTPAQPPTPVRCEWLRLLGEFDVAAVAGGDDTILYGSADRAADELPPGASSDIGDLIHW